MNQMPQESKSSENSIGDVIPEVLKNIKAPTEAEIAKEEAFNEAMEKREAEQERRSVSASFIRVSCIPERYKEIAVKKDTPWYKKALELKRKLNEGCCMFTFLGPRGTGKTAMACILMREYCNMNSKSIMYAKTMSFFRDLKTCFGTDRTEDVTMEKYLEPSLLVLDEIQVRSSSDWENNMLTHLIDLRYDALKSTIMIGNVAKEALAESIGESIYSRLVETGGVVEFNWKSFRG